MLPDSFSEELTARMSDSKERNRQNEETMKDNTKNSNDETTEYEIIESREAENAEAESEEIKASMELWGKASKADGEKTFLAEIAEKIQIIFRSILAIFTRKPVSSEVDVNENTGLSTLRTDVKISSEKEYTIMIYMVGSNLESGNGCASRDIEEMLGSGVDSSKINVLIYTGGTPIWKNGIPGSQNMIYIIEEGERVEVASTETPQNMGEANSLYEFLQFTCNYYPAKHYALICWDHGNGPIYGFGNDENFFYDGLTLGELKDALEKSPFGEEHKMDWMGYDACMMGTIEAAQAIEEYAGYFIASQEIIPGTGWNYAFLKILNEIDNTEDIAKEVIDTYRESEEQFGEQRHPDMTLACIDLAKISVLEEQLENLSVQLNLGLEEENYAELARKRDLTKRFGLGAVRDKESSLDLVDLADMAKQLEDEYSEEAEAIIQAVEEAVVYQTSNISDSCGMSIYYPYDNKAYYLNEGKIRYSEVTDLIEYQKYLESFSENWAKEVIRGEQPLSPESIGEESIDIALTQEQLKTLSSAYYHILASEGGGVYRPVLTGCKIFPDEEGILHIPSNPNLFYGIFEDRMEPILVGVEQVEYMKDRNTYLFNAMLYNEDEKEEGEVSVSFFVEKMNEPKIQNIRKNTDFLLHNGKNDIELDYQGYFDVKQKFYRMPEEKQGYIPYKKWELVEESEDSFFIFNDYFFIEEKPARETSEELICQVVLEDVIGMQSTGKVIMIHDGNPKIAGNINTPWPMTSSYRDGISAEYIPWVRLGGKEDAVSYCVECLWQYYDTVDVCWFCGANTISAQEYMRNYEFLNLEYERKVNEAMNELQELMGDEYE